jgi:hypothetical protein
MLLRKSDDKRRWDWTEGNIPWLPGGELPAAPLGDLKTSGSSSLSVWHIEGDRSNLTQVVAGLAARRVTTDKFDFALFPEDVLQDAQIQAKICQGDSADDAANRKWHRNLIELTASKLVRLARLIHQHGQVDRFLEQEVRDLIKEGVKNGRIDRKRLSDTLKEAVLRDDR